MPRKFSFLVLTVSVVMLGVGCNDEILTPPTGVPTTDKLEPRANLVRGNDLRQLIEGAPNGTTITLSGEYTVDAPILISSKDGLRIIGDGSPNTRILTTSNFSGLGVFQIGSDVTNFRMQGFGFKGTEPDGALTNLYAVFTSGSSPPTNISNLTFERLVIEDMGNGITIGGSPAGGCYGVTIYGNRIARMSAREYDAVDEHGPVRTTGGSGYGIHTQYCANVWIAKNHLEFTDRHAIYVANGEGPVKVEHNLMLNHFVGQTSCGYRNNDPAQKNECNQLTALHIARSQDVYAAFNLILNPHTDAMTIYFDDEKPNEAITGVRLIGNVVMGRRTTGFPVIGTSGAPTKDIHLKAAGEHEAWGNRFYRRGVVGPTSIPEVRPDAGSLSGAPQPWGSVDWIESYAGFENGPPSNNAFIRKNDQLHYVQKAYVDYSYGTWGYVNGTGASANWANFHPWGMAVSDDNAFAFASDYLYRTTPTSGGWVHVPTSQPWTGFQHAAFYGGFLFVLKDNALHKLNFSTADWDAWDEGGPRTGWTNPQGLVAFKGLLYIFIDNCIYERSAVDGSTTRAGVYWC